MKSILIALGATLMLAGCVVTPARSYRVEPVVTTDVVVYPRYEYEYYWDPKVQLYFYYGPRREVHYMPRGWSYRTHGVPGREHDRGRHKGWRD